MPSPEGIRRCLRCSREYTNPVPEVSNAEGTIAEIATLEWCPDCNRLAVSVVFRDRSVFFKKFFYDPLQGEVV